MVGASPVAVATMEWRPQEIRSPRPASEFYYKGWRGESEANSREDLCAPKESNGEEEEEEDTLQVVLNASGRDLAAALQRLIESGGDERSVTDPATGLTKYHTPSSPCEGVHRSCCTSNAPSAEAFTRGADTLRQLLLEAKNMSKQKKSERNYASPEDLFRKLLCDIRERLRSTLGLTFDDTISLFPSGTDAELMPSLLAFLRARQGAGRGADVFSIITAAGEVGSGTVLASTAKHFAKRLPSGRSGCCAVGDHVFGLGAGAAPGEGAFTGATLVMRDQTGRMLPLETRDRHVEETVREAIAAVDERGTPRYGSVVVHMVVGSKTGHVMPSEACLERLVAEHGDLVVPVVDACQGRLGDDDVRGFLDRGYLVLFTGSKFFGGPPFSGACFMADRVAQELDRRLTPFDAKQVLRESRLKEYVVAALISDDLPNLRSLLPQRPLNYGALMRWTMALHGMEQFFSDIPSAERVSLMRGWSKAVRGMVEDSANAGLVRLLDDTPEAGPEERGAALSTIVSFHCFCDRGKPGAEADTMTMDELRYVQYLMASDLVELFPQLNLPQLAGKRCFMGQPVDLVPESPSRPGVASHVLRVAASAPTVVRMCSHGLHTCLAEDQLLIEKLRLVLRSWHHFQKPSSL